MRSSRGQLYVQVNLHLKAEQVYTNKSGLHCRNKAMHPWINTATILPCISKSSVIYLKSTTWNNPNSLVHVSKLFSSLSTICVIMSWGSYTKSFFHLKPYSIQPIITFAYVYILILLLMYGIPDKAEPLYLVYIAGNTSFQPVNHHNILKSIRQLHIK